jgi:hypothetical protein
MSPDERWLDMDPSEMAQFSLEMNAERFRTMADDVLALPGSPLVVMEGTPLLPWLVEDYLEGTKNALWLIPTPEFQRERLLERSTVTWDETSDPERALANRIEREHRVTEAIERAADERGLTTLRVDGSRDLSRMQEAVEATFGPVLARGPSADTKDERQAMRRAENEIVLRQVRTYIERVPAAGTPESFVCPFSCECGESGCGAQPEMTIAEYERLLADGELLVAMKHAVGRRKG